MSVAHESMIVGHTHSDIGPSAASLHVCECAWGLNLTSRKWLLCLALFLVANLDAFFGMLTKLIRQGDEEMQLANVKLLNFLLHSFLNWF